MFDGYADTEKQEITRARFDRLPRVLRLAYKLQGAALGLEEELWPDDDGGAFARPGVGWFAFALLAVPVAVGGRWAQ